MTPEQFVYWLQGFLELSSASRMEEYQIKMIRDHLATVFHKVTPVVDTTRPWAPGDFGGDPTYCKSRQQGGGLIPDNPFIC